MQQHKFRVGDVVHLVSGPFHRAPAGDYEIVRLLPADNVENQYRVKHALDGHERVVKESQIHAS